jgi:hypothetical protein
MMTLVAVAALASLAASRLWRDSPSPGQRAVVLIASLVAGAFGLGAMRRPWVFLGPLIVLWVVTPTVDHPSFDVWNLSVGGCFLGWIIGTPAGWISRWITRAGESVPVASEPPEPP